ncbi:hypothetical protein J2X05_004200 [Cellvibrio fibrivorans]|uniref:Uncharacterized protein n=1 Tax=Cellvibrio fibrivorans TaxID=126350 RepID=A0ABU1V3W5_9GAMM|nr:hypothetical protein [Cellvibrio fibrivorans]
MVYFLGGQVSEKIAGLFKPQNKNPRYFRSGGLSFGARKGLVFIVYHIDT